MKPLSNVNSKTAVSVLLTMSGVWFMALFVEL